MDLVDGSEPKVRELLKGPVHGVRSPLGSSAFGRLMNGVQLSRNYGGVVAFDGTNDYIDLNAHASKVVPPGTQVTIEVVNFGEEVRNSSVIAGSHNGSTQSLNIHLNWSDGNIYWDCGTVFNRLAFNVGSGILGWHHWLFTKDATTGIMRIFKNGTQIAENSGQTSVIPTYTSMIVGAYTLNGSSLNYYHKAQVAALNVYNRVLTTNEILNSYANYKTRFNLP